MKEVRREELRIEDGIKWVDVGKEGVNKEDGEGEVRVNVKYIKEEDERIIRYVNLNVGDIVYVREYEECIRGKDGEMEFKGYRGRNRLEVKNRQSYLEMNTKTGRYRLKEEVNNIIESV